MSGMYGKLNELDEERGKRSSKASTNESTPQSTARSTDQSSGRSTKRSRTASTAVSPIVQRPKAFYITEAQDRMLNEVVKRLAEDEAVAARVAAKQVNPPDRSMVLRLTLEVIDLTNDKFIDQLVDQLID